MNRLIEIVAEAVVMGRISAEGLYWCYHVGSVEVVFLEGKGHREVGKGSKPVWLWGRQLTRCWWSALPQIFLKARVVGLGWPRAWTYHMRKVR